MLRAGQRWLCEYQPGITTIEAEILPANAASRRSFVSAGFREEKLCYKLDLKA